MATGGWGHGHFIMGCCTSHESQVLARDKAIVLPPPREAAQSGPEPGPGSSERGDRADAPSSHPTLLRRRTETAKRDHGPSTPSSVATFGSSQSFYYPGRLDSGSGISTGDAAPVASQDSPVRASGPSTPSQPSRVDFRQSLVARMNHMAISEHQATRFIMLQYRDLRPEDFELLCNLDETLPRRGTADERLLQVLPRGVPQHATECRVCLEPVAPTDTLLMLPCQHEFHPACITKWACEYRGDCPLCGKSLLV